MHRRKPISAKQRKEQLQLKRAVKRGDIPAPPPSKPDRHRKPRTGPTGQPLGSAARAAATQSSRRLESSFVKLPPPFLERTKVLAATLPLTRPIPPHRAILPDVDTPTPNPDPNSSAQLTCPRRPKWRYDMSKKEVEANELGLFKKWITQTDTAVDAWCNPTDVGDSSTPSAAAGESSGQTTDAGTMPHAPTSYERNLEVWRQLWRVTEISEIILVLLDSRCPTLHFPPALSAYLSSISNASRVRTILVLTKVDISGPARAAAWTQYLHTHYPGVRVVQVESYTEKFPAGAEGSSNATKKRMYEPHLPSAFRQTLVDALRETHAELLEPPPTVKSSPEKLARWKPRIKTEVDWNAVLNAHGGQVGSAVGGAAAPKSNKPLPDDDAGAPEQQSEEDDSEPAVLTIGLIGQPNVGKSSLLNALFGTQKVRASRTPGKTKHFQTLFWTSEVRLVDCPGLVVPNYVPMETQVLSGILPISRVSAIPLCIYHAAQLLPLETILGLAHPSLAAPPPADKRTWREGMRSRGPDPDANSKADAQEPVWTAMDILTAYATKKGWVTAKAGRPDVNRAGNAILRSLAEGRIRWAFWPPGSDLQTITAHMHYQHQGAHEGSASASTSASSSGMDSQNALGAGIWIAHRQNEDVQFDSSDDDEDEHDGRNSDYDDDRGGDLDGQRARVPASDTDNDNDTASDVDEDDHIRVGRAQAQEEAVMEDGSDSDGAELGNTRNNDNARTNANNASRAAGSAGRGRGGYRASRQKLSRTVGRFGALALDDDDDNDNEDNEAGEEDAHASDVDDDV